MPTAPSPQVMVSGMPVATVAAPYTVAGCAFVPPAWKWSMRHRPMDGGCGASYFVRAAVGDYVRGVALHTNGYTAVAGLGADARASNVSRSSQRQV